MTIVNLTPHTVTVNGKIFSPTGQIARCEETWDDERQEEGVKFLVGFKYGKTNLPEPDDSTFYIVSLPVALAEPNRTDILIPVGQIRDENGKIVGAEGLAKI